MKFFETQFVTKQVGSRWGIVSHMAMLLSVAFALAAIANVLSPVGIGWREAWSASIDSQAEQLGINVVEAPQVHQIVDAGSYVVLDARSAVDYEAGHLPGALSWPASDIEGNAELILPVLHPDQPVLVYCSGRSCDESLHLAKFLKSQGIKQINLFAGGYSEWKKGGYPLETGQ